MIYTRRRGLENVARAQALIMAHTRRTWRRAPPALDIARAPRAHALKRMYISISRHIINSCREREREREGAYLYTHESTYIYISQMADDRSPHTRTEVVQQKAT